MGANAQTSVPTFTAGEILTAANMNISARTGIPVFATTVTRDAAFGGTGEKTLAEGQFAYLEDSNTTHYYDGAAWKSVASNVVVQYVFATTSTLVSSSLTSQTDTTLTATITPTSASNKILIVVNQNGGVKTNGNVDNAIDLRLLRGATEIQHICNFAGFTNSLLSLYMTTISSQYLDSPATTSATTYKTTFANEVAAAGVRINEGPSISSIVLYEVTP